FKKLVDQDEVDLVLTTASAPSAAVAPLAEQRKVPLIAWACDERVSRGREYVMRSWVGGEYEGGFGAIEGLKRRYEKVAVVITTNDFPQSVRDGFLKVFPSERVAMSEEFLPDTKDFKPFILRATEKGARGFFICLNPGESSMFARQ